MMSQNGQTHFKISWLEISKAALASGFVLDAWMGPKYAYSLDPN